MHAYLPQRSVNRQRAFIGAVAAWSISTAWFVFLFQSAPLQWPLAALVVAAAIGALGSSGVVVEVRRSLVPGVAGWTDQVHLRWVIFWAVVFFIVKFTGISLAAKAHVG
jgi:hypothetical protein